MISTSVGYKVVTTGVHGTLMMNRVRIATIGDNHFQTAIKVCNFQCHFTSTFSFILSFPKMQKNILSKQEGV